jgi:hypothetical protein
VEAARGVEVLEPFISGFWSNPPSLSAAAKS